MAIVISGVNNTDKITATDGTIDLLSGVNYSSEVEVPSLKVGNNIQLGNAGIVTATSFAGNISGTTGTFGDFVNVGSNIQLGNAGVVTATTFTGNLTGNVNATSNLLFQIGGSEQARIDSNGRLLVNTTTTYVSNQIMIVKGSSPSGGNAPYDGQIAIEGSETNGAQDTGGVLAFIGHSGAGSRGFGSIRNLKEDGTSGNFGSYMSFHTRTNGSAPAEKLRINSTGQIITNGNATPYPTRSATFQPPTGQTNCYVSIVAGNTTSTSGLTFGDSAAAAAGAPAAAASVAVRSADAPAAAAVRSAAAAAAARSAAASVAAVGAAEAVRSAAAAANQQCHLAADSAGAAAAANQHHHHHYLQCHVRSAAAASSAAAARAPASSAAAAASPAAAAPPYTGASADSAEYSN